MKVLLVQPFKDPGLSGESWPPVNLGFLANALRESGHLVNIIDCLQFNFDYEIFIRNVKAFSPDLVGITLYSISLPFVGKMVDMVKEAFPGSTVVLGGPHVSCLPENILSYFKNVDFAVRGEGEVPLKKLAGYLESKNSNYSQIPGLIYRDEEKIHMNDPYFAKNIEEYGIPAWDLINPPQYFKYVGVGEKSIPVFFSRGCPFPCTFCSSKIISGQTIRRRSLDHIFKELNLLKTGYGIKRFIIEDEGFGTNKEFIIRFCERVRKELFDARFDLGVGMRLDIIDEELLEAMSESNFGRVIALGIESGSERVLKMMKKNTSLKLIRDKVNLMDRMGYEPTGYFILGYPDETREEMEETVKLALSLPLREASFPAFMPLPGTEATKMLMQNKELPQDFDFAVLATNKITYAPRGMSLKELEGIRRNALRRFYLRPKVLLRYFKSFRLLVYLFKRGVDIFLSNQIISKPSATIQKQP